ncbi:MAG TPA: hypothetical protein VLA78_00850 [Paracoccaceae bacterium]|jgi:hypothetical protein|nr:hypothetical protein [Paracoccaceae bacterium]
MSVFVKCFLADEDGAVTVDWVVLTAAIVGMGMLVLAPVAFETDSASQDVATFITDVPVGFGN